MPIGMMTVVDTCGSKVLRYALDFAIEPSEE